MIVRGKLALGGVAEVRVRSSPGSISCKCLCSSCCKCPGTPKVAAAQVCLVMS